MMADEVAAKQAKLMADHTAMVAAVDAITLVSLSSPKLMTGSWMSQFAIYVTDMSHPLETLQCAMVYQIAAHNIYTVLSDKVAVNLERSMITCYYKKEIIKQATYCIELHITTPTGATH